MPSTIRTSPSGYSSPYERIVVTSNRVVLNGSQNAAPATLEISQASGKFVAIQPGKASGTDYPSDTQFFDYGDLVIMPGLVDSHVHIDEPYRDPYLGPVGLILGAGLRGKGLKLRRRPRQLVVLRLWLVAFLVFSGLNR